MLYLDVNLSTRFIKGILNGEGNDGISPEHISANLNKSKSDDPYYNSHELAALHRSRENLQVLKYTVTKFEVLNSENNLLDNKIIESRLKKIWTAA
jgi:hypothetical protein